MYKIINFKEQVPYEQGYNLQLNAFEKVKNNIYDGILLILEHKPVYTIGSNGGWDNFLYNKEDLKKQGIDIVSISRGGNVTFHGPGQIVAYPIFNLSHLKKDIHWYIACLEDVIIDTLKGYGIEGSKKPQYRGVWIKDKKIAAIGVHVKRWTTIHGLSFNIHVDKKYFQMINPCGIKEFGVSALEDYLNHVEIDCVKQKLISSFEHVFNIKFERADKSIIERD